MQPLGAILTVSESVEILFYKHILKLAAVRKFGVTCIEHLTGFILYSHTHTTAQA